MINKQYIVYGDTTRHKGSQRCGIKIATISAENANEAYLQARFRYRGNYTNIKVRLAP